MQSEVFPLYLEQFVDFLYLIAAGFVLSLSAWISEMVLESSLLRGLVLLWMVLFKMSISVL